MGQDQSHDKLEDQKLQQRGKIEWLIGGVSGVVVVGMIGFVFFQAISRSVSGPAMEVIAVGVEERQLSYHVGFRVKNRGDTTAADVMISGTLESEGEVIESVEVAVDYVPGNSVRTGGMIFVHNPSQYQLRLLATAYNDP